MEKLILMILKTIIPVISPELKTGIDNLITELAIKAAKTPNKFDDILVFLLKEIFMK